MSSFDLSLLIPAYNESQRISPALDRIIEYLRAQTYSWELLIVDDGSRDETASLVAKRIEGITNAKLIAYQPNRGKGYAVRTGVLAAQGKWVVFSTPIFQHHLKRSIMLFVI